MIPARFDYHRPADVAAALALLGEHGEEARVLAGGHSLIPMMKLRMAAVAHLDRPAGHRRAQGHPHRRRPGDASAP